jgi:hypothetical protein
MQRRDFLQIAGVGITLSATNPWAWAEEPNQQPRADPNLSIL